MPKRKRDDEERLKKKMKKYEEKLKKLAVEVEATRVPKSPTPPLASQEIEDTEDDHQQDDTITEIEEDKLDEEILCLLGDAPQVQKFGPSIHKELATRWAGTIKNGLNKEKRTELKAKYLPPENCKTIDAPKLNLEAQAAMVDMAVKRDKAIASKQSQLGCALTALSRAFGKLLNKGKENMEIINCISDAARLLCDHQHQESLTRKNFILQGLEQSTRDAVKETEVDEWLFGEGFAEKLKASKAIKKSGQEISAKSKKPPQHQPKKSLNFRGPGNTLPRSQVHKPGPRQSYQNYKKTFPQTVKPQNNKVLPKAATNRN